jgi:hypothetical protein
MLIKNCGFSIRRIFSLINICAIVMLKGVEGGEGVHYLEACVVFVVL